MSSNGTPTGMGRFTTSGWALLPLRLFLGFTMLYAGMLKLSDPSFLDPQSPAGIQAQMRLAMNGSPVSKLVAESLEHASIVGPMIALGEIAVGVSLLLGIWVRLGALGGALLSLSFLLTVSWGTTPYFFGVDIVFLFAFIPLILAGDGGVWSVGSAIAARFGGSAKQGAPTAVDEPDGHRRALLTTGAVGVVAGVAAVAGALLARGTGSSDAAVATPTPSPSGSSPSPSSSATSSASASASASATPAGTVVATAADVPVGSAFAITLADSTPAFIVQPAAGTYLAYSRICTHEGCTVDFAAPEFVCPCHGAVFSEETGDPVSGPARTPLQKFDVREQGGSIYLV